MQIACGECPGSANQCRVYEAPRGGAPHDHTHGRGQRRAPQRAGREGHGSGASRWRLREAVSIPGAGRGCGARVRGGGTERGLSLHPDPARAQVPSAEGGTPLHCISQSWAGRLGTTRTPKSLFQVSSLQLPGPKLGTAPLAAPHPLLGTGVSFLPLHPPWGW